MIFTEISCLDHIKFALFQFLAFTTVSSAILGFDLDLFSCFLLEFRTWHLYTNSKWVIGRMVSGMQLVARLSVRNLQTMRITLGTTTIFSPLPGFTLMGLESFVAGTSNLLSCARKSFEL